MCISLLTYLVITESVHRKIPTSVVLRPLGTSPMQVWNLSAVSGIYMKVSVCACISGVFILQAFEAYLHKIWWYIKVKWQHLLLPLSLLSRCVLPIY